MSAVHSDWRVAVGATVLPHVGGIFGSLITRHPKNFEGWYEKLRKPSYQPPAWVFAPVWTTLYSAMGYASYRIWCLAPSQQRNLALGAYAAQLALNWAWTPIFFGKHWMGVALCEITVLTSCVGLTTYLFHDLDHTAGHLMMPYFAWASFASWITFKLWQLNSAGANEGHEE